MTWPEVAQAWNDVSLPGVNGELKVSDISSEPVEKSLIVSWPRLAAKTKCIVAGIADEDFVASAAGDGVVKIRSCNAVDAGERVSANRAIARGRATAAGADRDRHARSSIAILDLGGAVAGDLVVAAVALERVEAAVEEVRVIDIGKVAADCGIDAAGEGVVADRGRIASRRALRRTGAAGTDRDRHASRRVRVDHLACWYCR